MNPELLWVFIPTIAAISLTPGMCMTLAFTLGLSIGYKRTLWMMLGELSGVATVFAATFWSLGWLLSQDPVYFAVNLTDQSGAGAELANRLRALPS